MSAVPVSQPELKEEGITETVAGEALLQLGLSVPLSRLKLKEKGVIETVGGEGPLQLRLRELGLVPGTQVSVKRFAPFGDPMELEVRGYSLSIRKEDAGNIVVRPLRD